MIERLDNRSAIFALNKTFAAFILEVQDATYNPTHDYNKDESDEWNKERYEEFLKTKDYFEAPPIKDKHTGNIVYQLPHATLEVYLDNLANAVSELSDRLQWNSVIFLLDYATPWLEQDSEYEPVKKALTYLKRHGVDEKFTGGFSATGPELKKLVKNLFWITRSISALPTCYFSGINTDFIASICQYGNLHFHFYSEKCQLQIKEAAKELGLIEVEGGNCTQNFSEAEE